MALFIFAVHLKPEGMRNIFLFFLLIAQLGFAQNRQMTLDDAILGAYTGLRPETISGLEWRSEKEFTWQKNDTLWVESVRTGKKSALATFAELNEIIKPEPAFRRFPATSWNTPYLLVLSTGSGFYAINISEKKLEYKLVLPDGAGNAEFSKTGKFVAFTVDNNLFATFTDGSTKQITSDGGNGIVNGTSVHRNEFGISGGIFNSPAGNFIAFYRKDESMVKDYPLVDYMARMAGPTPVKYPMAGMPSEQITVGIYNISAGKTVFLKTGEPLDHYLTNLSWSPDEKEIYIAELNRGQNHMQLNSYSVETGEKLRTLFEEKSDTYVEPLYPIVFSPQNSNEFYELSRKNGWFHLYKYNTTGQLVKQITSGDWEVTRLVGIDAKEKYVFVEATKESPLESHIYKVEIKTGKMQKLSASEGIHNAVLSPEGGYLLDTWNAPEVPNSVDLVDTKGVKLKNLLTSVNPLQEYKLGENTLVSLKTANGKFDLFGRMIKPIDFDSTKKYPVVVYVYGGPHSQMVNKGWLYSARWWQYYMAAQGYIAFTLDNRGTSNRGRAFETTIHRQLGILETEDQMQGIEFLKSLPYVDASRIGVHGWSYGGFMTMNLMLRHPETFKVGVAGGPVVDWSMYEVMYGERYMDTPAENPGGFAESNMLNHIPKLDGKLMLIHGVQDETVVMQHSMKFLEKCIKEEKQVDFFVYPTHPHNVRGKDRVHLMKKVSDYFFDNL